MAPLPLLRWTSFALVLAAMPSSAVAQATAALLPRVGGDEAVPAELLDEARSAATAILRDEGLLVIESLRIDSLLDEADRQCLPSAPCVESVFQHAGVEVLVGLVLNGDASGVERVWVYVVRGDGVHEGAAAVDGDLADTVSDALRPLLDTSPPEDMGPFLRVEGTVGAHVSVDEEPVGDIPVTHATSAGAHVVEAQLEGRPSRRARVTLPDDPSHTTVLDLSLAETDPDPPVHWGIVVGAGAIAIGLGAAVLPPAISYVSAGCTDMGCREFEEVDDLVWVWTAVGGVVAGAGVGLLIWGASQGDASVQARLLPTGAQLEGRF